MRVYVLLVMRICVHICMWMCCVVWVYVVTRMTTGSMVMPHMVVSTINRVTCIITILRVVRVAAMVVWVYCMRMVYVVMSRMVNRMVSTRGVMVTIGNMVTTCNMAIVRMIRSPMVAIVYMSWSSRMGSNRVVGGFCSGSTSNSGCTRGSRGSRGSCCARGSRSA
jgi:hypothetical protein